MKYILFDAANTLIYKPSMYTIWQTVLSENGYQFELDFIRFRHHLVSELVRFPDRTSQTFYAEFNTKVLFSLGVIPSESILQALFKRLTYQKWELFDHCKALDLAEFPIVIVSNFRSELQSILTELLPHIQFQYLISEQIGLQKQDAHFYNKVLEKLEVSAHEVVYIGDSIQIDVAQARKQNIPAYLIDRYTYYQNSPFRFSSLFEFIQFANSSLR